MISRLVGGRGGIGTGWKQKGLGPADDPFSDIAQKFNDFPGGKLVGPRRGDEGKEEAHAQVQYEDNRDP